MCVLRCMAVADLWQRVPGARVTHVHFTQLRGATAVDVSATATGKLHKATKQTFSQLLELLCEHPATARVGTLSSWAKER